MNRGIIAVVRCLLLTFLALGAIACYLEIVSTHQIAPITDSAIQNAEGETQSFLIREKHRRECRVFTHQAAFFGIGIIDLAGFAWIAFNSIPSRSHLP